MARMHSIRQAEYISGHKLRLSFEDESVRVVDLAPYLDGEVFEPLRDEAYFRTVRVDGDIDTIVWDNGADFSPDFLYEIGQEVQEHSAAGRG